MTERSGFWMRRISGYALWVRIIQNSRTANLLAIETLAISPVVHEEGTTDLKAER
jgi:hypothetical protein